MLLCFLSLCFLTACGSSSIDPTVTASEVHVSTSQMDVVYQRGDVLDETFMVFGGLAMDLPEALSKVTIVGLGMADAQPIWSRYPDFHKCASQGAQMAQAAIRQMDIVPANANVLASLEDALGSHEASLREGDATRVCVKLRGCVLTIRSASAEGEDITSQLPPQLMHEYWFVEAAEIVDAEQALRL